MYSTCLFCSAFLGTNEAMETFPVGERVAFDAAKGRLWAACGRCGRWNLAPIEERWEAVEQAESLFRDTRSRVQSENIGLARLADGTRLIRVGSALPGELAAWRYGGQLISRRRRNIAVTGAAVATGAALVIGMPLIVGAGVPIGLLNAGLQLGSLAHMRRQRMRIVHRSRAAESPTGQELVIRRWHLDNAVLVRTEDGGVALDMVPPSTSVRQSLPRRAPADADRTFRLSGDAARRVLVRSMSDYNQGGASKAEVARAIDAIARAGGAETFALQAAETGVAIWPAGPPRRGSFYSVRQILGTFKGERLPVVKYGFSLGRSLKRTDALALEMALQDEAERRALQGELATLEAAWREAEEIAHIADALPDDPDD
jgi:hypothetical protein